MAAATLSATAVPQDNTGLNLTEASFTTLVVGGTNGVKFTYNPTDILVLKNDTGGPATFSFTPTVPATLTAQSITLSAQTVVIATAKTYFIRPIELYKDTATGTITVTCDVAGKSLLLSPL